jgi:hypothetical protein
MQPRSYANTASHAADAIQDVYEKIYKDHIQPNNYSDAALSAHEVSAHEVSAHEVSAHEVRDPHNILTILNSMRSRL